jgi:hypothetical protein
MRHLCVYTVAVVHCIVVSLTCAFSRVHTARFFGVDTAVLREAEQRRATTVAMAESSRSSQGRDGSPAHSANATGASASLSKVVCK